MWSDCTKIAFREKIFWNKQLADTFCFLSRYCPNLKVQLKKFPLSYNSLKCLLEAKKIYSRKLSPNLKIPEYLLTSVLSLENKMKTPYRKLTIKTGVNEFEIFDILSIAVKIWRQKSWKSRCTWVAESSWIGVFHWKWTQSKIKVIF